MLNRNFLFCTELLGSLDWNFNLFNLDPLKHLFYNLSFPKPMTNDDKYIVKKFGLQKNTELPENSKGFRSIVKFKNKQDYLNEKNLKGLVQFLTS